MRNTFATELVPLFEKKSDLVLYYADIGNRLFDPLKAIASDRVINVGIAEANMASMAAGSSKLGLKPIIYTITPFTTARNFEQIKIDIAYQHEPVVIVGTGSGFSYANLGPTHHSFEDIALMRVLPNMQVVCPCDSNELKILLNRAIASKNPTYLRIGKKNEPIITKLDKSLEIGKVNVIESGSDIAILTTGTIIDLAAKLSESLKSQGVSTELVSIHSIKPLDEEYLSRMCRRFIRVIVLEEHSVIGGLGSAILEWMNSRGQYIPLSHFAIPDRFYDQVSSLASARVKAGLTLDRMLRNLKDDGIIIAR